MTPAVRRLTELDIRFELLSFEYHQTDAGDVGMAAARALALDPATVYKTLVVRLPAGELAVTVIPVARQLNLKRFARLVSAKSAALAEPGAAERATGYLVGGISPIGQKRQLETFVDAEALDLPQIYVSAGKRGLELGLRPSDLVAATGARVEPLTAHAVSG